MKVLITGVAGFIGFHLGRRLLKDGIDVVGIDNLNAYYDPKLKQDRLSILKEFSGFNFHKIDIVDRDAILKIFKDDTYDVVVHLAAQAGVRYSIENPYTYIDSNVVGFINILEGCKQAGVGHLAFASSSSVYGANKKMPFSVHDNVDHPISLYGATKKAGELMAHTYSSLYSLPCTGLRFFTVYGPWGRPDMALFKFTKAILEDLPIDLYNYGEMTRDFTYIDDVIEGVARIMNSPPKPNPSWDGNHPDPSISYAPYRIYNIGGSRPVELMYFIDVLEKALGKKAEKNMLPLQAGDVITTCADADDLELAVGFRPETPLETGIVSFVKWYKSYYRI